MGLISHKTLVPYSLPLTYNALLPCSAMMLIRKKCRMQLVMEPPSHTLNIKSGVCEKQKQNKKNQHFDSMMTLSLASQIFLFAHLSFVSSVEVTCKSQQEACTCEQNTKLCEFTLNVEELQTFASYEVSRDRSTRRTPGRTYFLNDSGFSPVVPDLSVCSITPPTLYDDQFTNQGCSVPMTVDGVTYRRFIAVNGRIPGPTLIVTENQLVKVRVQNNLTSEAITIHWHGMHQRGTPWMDGVGFISQYPITAGEYFDYIFNATPAGTHWYHSHVGGQRTDGLFGALVVREKTNYFTDTVVPRIKATTLHVEPYQSVYDLPENHTITLLDWQREDSLDLFVKIHSSLRFHINTSVDQVPTTRDSLYNPTTSLDKVEIGPVPYWTGLINGRGRKDSSTYAPLTVFNVLRESAYRFRVIGAQSLYAYSLSIDGHKLTVIAADGHFIEPVIVDYLIVHSGERYDFIVETFDNFEGQAMFWIRAETLETNVPAGRNHTALAILKYGATDTVDWRGRYKNILSIQHSCTASEQCIVLNCPFANYSSSANRACMHLTQLRSLFPTEDKASLPKIKNDDAGLKFFNFGFEGQSETSAVNGKNFRLPVIPYQTNCGQYEKDVEAGSTCDKCTTSSEECECTHVVKIVQDKTFSNTSEPNSVVMVFSAIGRGFNSSHPIHLHGHSFYILHIGHGEYNDNGVLIRNSTDVVCNDNDCTAPSWRDGIQPSGVTNIAETGNRIKDNLIRKDTVIVPAGGYVVVAFQADNPGYWFLHCHIEVHQLEGMGVLIQEYNYTQHKAPPKGIDTAGHFEWTMENYTNVKDNGLTCSSAAGEIEGHLIMQSVLGLFSLLLV